MKKIKNNTDWDNCAIEHFKLGADKMKAAILSRYDDYVWASESNHRIFKEIRKLIKNVEV